MTKIEEWIREIQETEGRDHQMKTGEKEEASKVKANKDGTKGRDWKMKNK